MEHASTCAVTVNGGRAAFSCRAGLTLFAALRINRLPLPTGCGARGLCGGCRVRLDAGAAPDPTDSERRLLSDAERAEGYRLACQLHLAGDVAITIPDFVFGAAEHSVTLTAVTELTHDIRRFHFRLAPGDRLPHRAGQFVSLAAAIPGSHVRAVRCFSFATPASVEDSLDLIIRRNPTGVLTPYLFDQALPGDSLTVTGPYGDFSLRPGTAPCVWIAGGSGLSPFLGMIRDLVDRQETERQVDLFFGAVRPGDLYYLDLLQDIERENAWFRFVPALSGDERTDRCREYGLITEVVARRLGDASGAEGYLCGSPGMIEACIAVLTAKGMARENITYDRF
ncbi:MAG: 2Fe-2S iron-sulfur cluster binding domain-containing protein [Planctomycetes bacterium]|nr:2Fe-2S iron-sulfur cluster binding domain-containing protein [Planctomycetota bacterium]